jgi:hypothetical protein
MKIKVRCTLIVEIEAPDDPEYDAEWDIEENHCPGTGLVGSAIDAVMGEAEDKRVCWACNLQGKNEIIRDEPNVIDVVAYVIETVSPNVGMP